VDRIHLAENNSAVDSWVRGNQPLGYIKGREYLELLCDC
jgi:hypothetical protein